MITFEIRTADIHTPAKKASIFGPENLPERLPKTIFCVSQAPKNFSSLSIPRQVIGVSSHAFENVFGKLVGDKMAAAGELFLKGLFHEIIK